MEQPVIVARMPYAKEDGYASRASAAARRTRDIAWAQNGGANIEIEPRDGRFWLIMVTRITPGPATTPCLECGKEVDTVRAGDGDFSYERCPARPTNSHFTSHRVDSTPYFAAKAYRSAQFGIINRDPHYSVEA
jgi:hypothetical protein